MAVSLSASLTESFFLLKNTNPGHPVSLYIFESWSAKAVTLVILLFVILQECRLKEPEEIILSEFTFKHISVPIPSSISGVAVERISLSSDCSPLIAFKTLCTPSERPAAMPERISWASSMTSVRWSMPGGNSFLTASATLSASSGVVIYRS